MNLSYYIKYLYKYQSQIKVSLVFQQLRNILSDSHTLRRNIFVEISFLSTSPFEVNRFFAPSSRVRNFPICGMRQLQQSNNLLIISTAISTASDLIAIAIHRSCCQTHANMPAMGGCAGRNGLLKCGI